MCKFALLCLCAFYMQICTPCAYLYLCANLHSCLCALYVQFRFIGLIALCANLYLLCLIALYVQFFWNSLCLFALYVQIVLFVQKLHNIQLLLQISIYSLCKSALPCTSEHVSKSFSSGHCHSQSAIEQEQHCDVLRTQCWCNSDWQSCCILASRERG